jgi:hypothetical protein
LGLGAAATPGTGGSNGKGGTTGAGGTNATSGGSSNGSGATSSSGSSGTTSVIGFDPDAGQTGGSGPVDPDAACASVKFSATLKTVNMFVMFDRSWSMTECGDSMDSMFAGGDPRCMTGPSRWALTSAALIQFIQDPAAAGLRMALRFFPDDHPVAGCDGYPTTTVGGFMMGGTMGGTMGFGGAGRGNTTFGAGGATGAAGRTGVGTAGSPAATGTGGATDNCDANACAQPLVDIGALTADPAPTDIQEQKLVDAINMSAPPDVATLPNNPQTPTSAALQGAVNWATTYEAAHMDQNTVIILITDGEPQGCDTNATNIANIAAMAYQNGIPTYVIGLGGLNSMPLNQIAAAGGTKTAFTVSASMSSTTELLNDLVAIQGQALKCNLPVPTMDSNGKKIDPSYISVAYQSGQMGMSNDVSLVSSMDKCGSDQGWYFDNPAAPTQILLCPATCDTVTKDQQAQVEINVLCKMNQPVR